MHLQIGAPIKDTSITMPPLLSFEGLPGHDKPFNYQFDFSHFGNTASNSHLNRCMISVSWLLSSSLAPFNPFGRVVRIPWISLPSSPAMLYCNEDKEITTLVILTIAILKELYIRSETIESRQIVIRKIESLCRTQVTFNDRKVRQSLLSTSSLMLFPTSPISFCLRNDITCSFFLKPRSLKQKYSDAIFSFAVALMTVLTSLAALSSSDVRPFITNPTCHKFRH